MPRLLLVTRSNWMLDFGAGGRHRSYQIQQDLAGLVGADNLDVLVPGQGVLAAEEARAKTRGAARLHRLSEGARRLVENPLRLRHMTAYSARQVMTTGFVGDYATHLGGAHRPAVVVLEDARFAPLLALNQAEGIPTVVCPHKFEALPTDGTVSAAELRARLLDFSHEVAMLRGCDARLFLSKVEAGFVSGLGIEAGVYPYAPRGDLLARWETIRAQRAGTQQDSFLLVGRASFAPTRRALTAFLNSLRDAPLPGELHLVGAEVERLPATRGVTLHGYIDHDTLDALLVRARAALLPWASGFGAPTRLADFAHAGVPVIASDKLAQVVDLPPHVTLAADQPAAWRAAVESIPVVTDAQHRAYVEHSRDSALVDIVRRWLG
jgi:hypothetical protein